MVRSFLLTAPTLFYRNLLQKLLLFPRSVSNSPFHGEIIAADVVISRRSAASVAQLGMGLDGLPGAELEKATKRAVRCSRQSGVAVMWVAHIFLLVVQLFQACTGESNIFCERQEN